MHWLYHLIAWLWGGDGQGGPSSTGYLITSGPLAASAVVGAASVWLWRSRCEEPRCWRLARREDVRGNHICRVHFERGLPQPIEDAIRTIREANERAR